MSGQAAELPGLGASLAASLVSLGIVCLLAWVALRWLAKRGGAISGRDAGPVRVLARCALEPRRSLYLIEVAGRGFLVGVGEGGAMTTLGEIDVAALPAAPTSVRTPVAASFADLLARVLARPSRKLPDSTAADGDRSTAP